MATFHICEIILGKIYVYILDSSYRFIRVRLQRGAEIPQ